MIDLSEAKSRAARKQEKLILFTQLIVVALFSVSQVPTAWAKTASRKPASTAPSGVEGVVQTENAQVYSLPDFDAPVIATLQAGQKVRVSKGLTGSYVKFHKVRVGPKIGYIVDIDVSVDGQRSVDAKSLNKRKKSRGKNRDNAKKDPPPHEAKPLYFSRYVGLTVGAVQYKEGISGVDANDTLLMYGLKITGPDTLLKGPVLDFNLTLHNGAPSYYNALSKVKPGGFVLFTDVLIEVPFFQRLNSSAVLGFGPLLVYSSFQVLNANRSQSLTSVNLGVSAMVGYAVRFGSVSLRLEGKYLVEKQSYKALQASILSEF